MDDLQKAAADVKEAAPEPQEEVKARQCARSQPQSFNMNGLLTDLYELTMAAGYFEAGKADEKATFEFTIRRLPPNRNFVMAAGLPQVVDYLLNLSFTGRGDRLPARACRSSATPRRHSSITCAASASPATCSPCPKGTPLFAGEPVLTHARADHRGADPGDLPALRHHASRP